MRIEPFAVRKRAPLPATHIRDAERRQPPARERDEIRLPRPASSPEAARRPESALTQRGAHLLARLRSAPSRSRVRAMREFTARHPQRGHSPFEHACREPAPARMRGGDRWPSRVANSTGRQSATITTQRGPRARDRRIGSDRHTGAARESRSATTVPCTWLSQARLRRQREQLVESRAIRGNVLGLIAHMRRQIERIPRRRTHAAHARGARGVHARGQAPSNPATTRSLAAAPPRSRASASNNPARSSGSGAS